MDNSLVLNVTRILSLVCQGVLILVVMDNSLVHMIDGDFDFGQAGLNPCCNGQ